VQPEVTTVGPEGARELGAGVNEFAARHTFQHASDSRPGTYTLGVVVSAFVLGTMLGALSAVLASGLP
jgi:hypothetical protein